MHRFLPFHSWLTHVVAAHLSGLALLTGLQAPAPAAHTVRPNATPPALSMVGDMVNVKTANGQSWRLSVSAANQSLLDLTLLRPAGRGLEVHDWSFASSALAFDPATGTGTVSGGTATGHAADVALKFHATSHQAVHCASGRETVYSGTLSGTAILHTGLRHGGAVGGQRMRFTAPGSRPEIISDSNCSQPAPATLCTSASLFIASGSPTSVAGVTGDLAALLRGLGGSPGSPLVSSLLRLVRPLGAGLVALVHQARVTGGRNAARFDVALAAARTAWDGKHHVFSVAPRAHGFVTGAATLSGGKPMTSTQRCKAGGRIHRETTVVDNNARYHSRAGHVITAHTSLTGDIAGPRTAKQAFYLVLRLK